MEKLTNSQIQTLKAFKNTKDGPYKFFDELERIYTNDKETIEKIQKLKEMRKLIETEIDSWPAYSKSIQMYYDYMDKFRKEIGYEM